MWDQNVWHNDKWILMDEWPMRSVQMAQNQIVSIKNKQLSKVS